MTPNLYVLSFRNIHCTSTTSHSILSAGGQQWAGEQTSRPLVGFTRIKQQTCLYQAGVNIPTSQRQNWDAKSHLARTWQNEDSSPGQSAPETFALCHMTPKSPHQHARHPASQASLSSKKCKIKIEIATLLTHQIRKIIRKSNRTKSWEECKEATYCSYYTYRGRVFGCNHIW